MMRLTILAVGRLKSVPEQLLAADYARRAAQLGRPLGIAAVDFIEVPESKAKTAALRRSEEARALLAHIPKRAFLVALEAGGKQFTSENFAAELRRLIDRGVADLVFLIGGPDGHGREIDSGAGLQLSLGKMTWPHRLVRPMLAEQIYRSVTILVNHPYHRA
jgi:23S rRNA (pseudouridine1915-N3)-methyltransferase